MMEQMQYAEAMTHYIEAGENMKAVQAAIQGRQWQRASEILDQQRDENDPEIAKYYLQLGSSRGADRFVDRFDVSFQRIISLKVKNSRRQNDAF